MPQIPVSNNADMSFSCGCFCVLINLFLNLFRWLPGVHKKMMLDTLFIVKGMNLPVTVTFMHFKTSAVIIRV